MKRSRFSEAQVAFVLRQAEEGTKVEEVCRKAGISPATFYAWKSIYGPPPICKHSEFSVGPLGLPQSIRPVRGALIAPGHDGFRASLSQLNYPACKQPRLPSGYQVTPVDRWSISPLVARRPREAAARSKCRLGFVISSLGQQRPCGSGLLVGQRDGSYVGVGSALQGRDPAANRGRRVAEEPEHASRAVDQQRSDVRVAALADAKQRRSTTC